VNGSGSDKGKKKEVPKSPEKSKRYHRPREAPPTPEVESSPAPKPVDDEERRRRRRRAEREAARRAAEDKDEAQDAATKAATLKALDAKENEEKEATPVKLRDAGRRHTDRAARKTEAPPSPKPGLLRSFTSTSNSGNRNSFFSNLLGTPKKEKEASTPTRSGLGKRDDKSRRSHDRTPSEEERHRQRKVERRRERTLKDLEGKGSSPKAAPLDDLPPPPTAPIPEDAALGDLPPPPAPPPPFDDFLPPPPSADFLPPPPMEVSRDFTSDLPPPPPMPPPADGLPAESETPKDNSASTSKDRPKSRRVDSDRHHHRRTRAPADRPRASRVESDKPKSSRKASGGDGDRTPPKERGTATPPRKSKAPPASGGDGDRTPPKERGTATPPRKSKAPPASGGSGFGIFGGLRRALVR
jgi:hypothetical protein